MTRPAPDSRPRLAPGCRLSEAPGQESTLLMPESALRLKGPSVRILQSCDGLKTFSEIVKSLQAEFSAGDPKNIEEDVAAFLEQLHSKRAVDY